MTGADDPHQRLHDFLRPDCPDRLFRVPTGNPARPTGFCFCDQGRFTVLRLCLRSLRLQLACALPGTGGRIRLLRRLGAAVADEVFLSAGGWIDPIFPHLITIEDGVFLGMGVRLNTHEYRRDEFRAGRVILRRNAFIGAHAIIACGVEVGEGATVAAGCVLGRDVPAGATAIGNPMRILPRGADHGT